MLTLEKFETEVGAVILCLNTLEKHGKNMPDTNFSVNACLAAAAITGYARWFALLLNREHREKAALLSMTRAYQRLA